MKNTIGGTWILQLAILFILIFVSYIALTLNYSRTIKTKNETISIIEKYDGLNDSSVELINSFLRTSGYSTTGSCDNREGIYGSIDLNDSKLVETSSEANQKYYYCIKKLKGTGRTNYYQVTLFYKFNLPVLGDISSFTVKGSTSNFESKDKETYSKVFQY